MATPVDANAASMTNDPQPRLSPEICERIIDHLRPIDHEDERQTVLKRALVCRGWYADSRAVFFEIPELHTRRTAVVYVRSLQQMPLLADRVRHLVIGTESLDAEETIMTCPDLASILMMLAGKLPKLASLSFFDVSFDHCSMRHLAFWNLHELKHITTLSLVHVTLPSASPFIQVICSFPRLQSLICGDLHWSKSRTMAPLPERRLMPLTKSLPFYMTCRASKTLDVFFSVC
ncbi:uncharacterized protein LAESUDRAFT_36938 [Laetiporus sulphureus 93-53]|uniref:F-box domain-containing protein n=1 Tax=Laetiporus sulphureus 93-53 TaxID=1314785 RepID=A0A165ILR2_9APHY|nr:uncharacterized protein LAESUDRAFT_36938 [Laetiporus sulphureus 93-53]KZT13255.1 hypothetical protein LAESUDRAFT_36938 [Laetiporus sulphureus 93-53]